jgi:hypothetical protein
MPAIVPSWVGKNLFCGTEVGFCPSLVLQSLSLFFPIPLRAILGVFGTTAHPSGGDGQPVECILQRTGSV